MKYIERFSSLVPAVQGNKVVRQVEDLKNKGQIQTEDEYNDALEQILSDISTSEFKPLFKYVPITSDISSSEHFNMMMDSIRDDLEVIFIELNNIFTVIKAHDTIFKDKLLDELHFTLKELENQADSLSVIADSSNSFDSVFLNSFNGDNFLLDRNNEFANEIFFDFRKNLRIPNENLAFIDTSEQAILLPLLQQEDIEFNGASIRTAETTATQVNIQLVDSNILNLLDSDVSSSWAYNILLKNPLKAGAKLSLELDLGDKREINYLKIHPISDFPVLLEKIQYVNINNNIEDLPDQTFFNRTLENPVRITFPDIIAKKIILKLSQSSSILFDYDENRPEVTFDDLKRNTSLSRSAGILTNNILENVEDPDLLGVIPLIQSQPENFNVYNQYIFAFKDISTGLSAYKNDGYFLSKAYKKGKPALIGFESSESIPEYFDEEASVIAKTSSIEYSIVKKDFNGSGALINTSEFSILPVGSTEVSNERLFFSGDRALIPLRFLGHSSSDDGSAITIFRNNVQLVRGLDWRFYDRLNPLDDSDPILKPNQTSTRIEILNSLDVIRTGIYTANYIPRYISEPDSIVSENGIVYLSNGSTEHPTTFGIESVENSDLFVKISMRNNSAFINRTPKLDFYKLLVSSVDSDKYVRI